MKNTTTTTQTHSTIVNNTPNIARDMIIALNKLKQLLLFSILTFSLNVASANGHQTFNKINYLDFNSEYNWNNNTGNPTQQDNPATTLLKQMAGTVRNTLGATNSNNANQFGSTLKNNFKNQAVSKAISSTQNYLNNKVNEYANKFGTGRTEITFGGFESDALTYNIRTIQPISPFNEDSIDLTFFQGQIASGQNHGQRRETLNLGIGYRQLLEAGQAIVSINLFTDYETQSEHSRASLGLEYQRTNFSANANTYTPISNLRVIGDSTEQVLSGYDLRLIGQVPYLPWAQIEATHYYWNGKQEASVKGNILGFEVQLSDAIRFEIGTEKSNTADRSSYARLSIALPFENDKATDFIISKQAFEDSGQMLLNEFAWVERSNKIRIEKRANVINATETTPFSINPIADISIAENIAFTGSTPTLSGDSPVGTLTYSLSGNDALDFSIDTTTGVISMIARDFEAPVDADTNNDYEVAIIATDSNGNTASVIQTISVTNVAETTAFAINPIADTTVAENTAFTGSTPNLNGSPVGTLTYSLSGNDALDFSIDTTTGVISMIARDFEAPVDADTNNDYEVTITATDADNNIAFETQTVSVTNIIENTIIINPQTRNINENSADGTSVGAVLATTGDPTGFSITAGNTNNAFTIDNSGQIIVNDSNQLDFEGTISSYTLTVQISRADAVNKSAAITINVTDVIEIVVFSIGVIADTSIAENTAFTGSTPILTGDTPIGDTVTYSLGGTDEGNFEIDTTTGVISMIARDFEAPVDADTNNDYEVTIVATDADNNTAFETQTVSVTDVVELTIN